MNHAIDRPRGFEDLLKPRPVAAVDLEACGARVKWEESRGGALFPHLYDRLLLETLVAYGPLARDDAGQVTLPVTG